MAVTPVPSIHDTINQGVGGKALAQTAIKNPDDPQWSGRTQVSVAAKPVLPRSPGAVSAPSSAAAVRQGTGGATTVAAGPSRPPSQPARTSSLATTTLADLPARPPIRNQAPSALAGSSQARAVGFAGFRTMRAARRPQPSRRSPRPRRRICRLQPV